MGDGRAVSTAELSTSETRVARLVGLGHANKFIAYELGVAPSTVASHLSAIQQKLGLSTRLDVVLAMRPERPVDERTLATIDALTPAQYEVLQRWCAGDSVAALAARRGCSGRTVQKHIQAIYRMFLVNSRAELVARLGLLRMEDHTD